MTRPPTFFCCALFIALLGAAGRGMAQEGGVAAGPIGLASRSQLEVMLARHQAVARSDAYDEQRRTAARSQAARIRQRLDEGDFQVGDRVLLHVRGEEMLSDTLIVGPMRALTLPGIGKVSLAGVLRSELEAHLSKYVARFVRDPVVRADLLLRVMITGEVDRPGVYAVPPETMLTEALMRAGGLTQAADLTAIRVERGDERILDEDAVQAAIEAGTTFDQLDLHAGDRIVVPRRGGIGTAEVLQFVLAIPAVIFAVSQFF